MNFDEVKELINVINESDIRTFEIAFDGASIKMSKNHDSAFNVKNASEETPMVNFGYISDIKDNEITKNMNKGKVSVEPEKKEITGNTVRSPIVGTLYLSPAPDKDNFVKVGDRVNKGDTICIVEAMKVMNEVTSEFDGEVKAVLAENESLVEYGQPLFLIG